MTGVAGVVYYSGAPVDPSDLSRMADALAHRGPDGAATWTDGRVGLAHCLLRTMPELATESLPRLDPTTGLAITADARLDNRADLVIALGLDPSRFSSDGDLLLHGYRRWGTHTPEHLLGDFVFAIWDPRDRALFCARDHFGVKPLYYHHSSRLFSFASEIKALFRLVQIPRRLNERRVPDYLFAQLEDKASTFYQDIWRLPPACWLLVTPDGIRLQAYWSPDSERELHLSSDREYEESFRDLFTEAVRCRLPGSGARGVLLSGGLDSSSVACVAARLSEEDGSSPIHTFSAIFDEVPQCDERPFIEAALGQGGMLPHYVHADRLSPFANFDQML